jgi:hypothetical protein
LSSENFVTRVKEVITAATISITKVFFMRVIFIKIFFFIYFLALPQKVTKSSGQALIAPRILPAVATATLRYFLYSLGHYALCHFYLCLVLVYSLHYNYS